MPKGFINHFLALYFSNPTVDKIKSIQRDQRRWENQANARKLFPKIKASLQSGAGLLPIRPRANLKQVEADSVPISNFEVAIPNKKR